MADCCGRCHRIALSFQEKMKNEELLTISIVGAALVSILYLVDKDSPSNGGSGDIASGIGTAAEIVGIGVFAILVASAASIAV